METEFFTAVEVARILKVSRALSYRLIAQGQIVSVRFGRTVRIGRTDLEQFIERHSSDSGLSQVPAVVEQPATAELHSAGDGEASALESSADLSPSARPVPVESHGPGPPAPTHSNKQ